MQLIALRIPAILVACWRQLDEKTGDALKAITRRKLLHCRRNEGFSGRSYRNYAFLFLLRDERRGPSDVADVVFRTSRRDTQDASDSIRTRKKKCSVLVTKLENRVKES